MALRPSSVSLAVVTAFLSYKPNAVLSFSPGIVDSMHKKASSDCPSTCRYASGQRTPNAGINKSNPVASLVGHVPEYERRSLEQALTAAGFDVHPDYQQGLPVDGGDPCYEYSFSRATGMLKLESTPTVPSSQANRSTSTGNASQNSPPQWIPLVKNMENILVANGWSFLDPDENEDMSAYNVDAANLEGQYKPSWGTVTEQEVVPRISKVGYSLQRMTTDEIQMEVLHSLNNDLTRRVLLEGATDPPHVKDTHNGYSFAGSVQNLMPGVFLCAIGGLPLFTTQHLSPSTATSGWLSFSQPVSEDHIQLIHPDINAADQRIEVICAKSGCHLGHYFGKANGYCINASVLNFIPSAGHSSTNFKIEPPHSWLALEELPLVHSTFKKLTRTETILLGAGCFWHVEFALRRLPGVVSTKVGFAGGCTGSSTSSPPTYEQVCATETGHAEVVQVEFDPTALEPRILFDCFLALHDPTKVRAHGKHAQGTGQYRSCIFIGTDNDSNDDTLAVAAYAALEACREQLQKELSTEVAVVLPAKLSFWPAEERHQQHEERRNPASDKSTLPSVREWLKLYGKRSPTIVGSAATLNSLTSM